jgi:hypothetical protein
MDETTTLFLKFLSPLIPSASSRAQIRPANGCQLENPDEESALSNGRFRQIDIPTREWFEYI